MWFAAGSRYLCLSGPNVYIANLSLGSSRDPITVTHGIDANGPVNWALANMSENRTADMGPLRPQYPGDDTRPTSRKELAGWYCYGWAAEVFTVCAMGRSISKNLPFGYLGLLF